MAISKKQIKQIKDIIEKYYHAFIVKNLGIEHLDDDDQRKVPPSVSTEDHFKNAYLVGKTQGSTPQENTSQTYDQFLTEVFNRSLGTSNMDQKTLDIVKESIAHYIHNLKNRTLDTVIGTIHDKNKEEHLQTIGEVKTPYQQAQHESENIQELSRDLRKKTGDIGRDWERVVRTELGNIHNHGSMNAIIERNKTSGRTKEDILVYKQGPLDAATCDKCVEFWHEGGSYKIYRLSELADNGTNIGRKMIDWVATVDVTHPRCRHRLMELLPGWTLDEDGRQTYVSPDHDEFDNDLKKSLKGKTPTFTGWKLHKRIKFQGLNLSIENRAGTYRKWKGGKTLMHVDYGYIRRTLGNDGDHVDCYVGQNLDSKKVYVIHQIRPDSGEHDEDKVMLGYDSSREAKKSYLKHIPEKFFGSMDEMTIDEFKKKVIGKEVDLIKSTLESLKF